MLCSTVITAFLFTLHMLHSYQSGSLFYGSSCSATKAIASLVHDIVHKEMYLSREVRYSRNSLALWMNTLFAVIIFHFIAQVS